MKTKTVIFEGIKTLDMKPNDDINRGSAIQIAYNRVLEDLKQYPEFKGKPDIVKEVVDKNDSYYVVNFWINNKSGTYEDMYYQCIIDNSEIFTYVIEELEKSIKHASMSRGFYE